LKKPVFGPLKSKTADKKATNNEGRLYFPLDDEDDDATTILRGNGKKDRYEESD
jgi:hypothetical protein